jgi:hypothetical protein
MSTKRRCERLCGKRRSLIGWFQFFGHSIRHDFSRTTTKPARLMASAKASARVSSSSRLSNRSQNEQSSARCAPDTAARVPTFRLSRPGCRRHCSRLVAVQKLARDKSPDSPIRRSPNPSDRFLTHSFSSSERCFLMTAEMLTNAISSPLSSVCHELVIPSFNPLLMNSYKGKCQKLQSKKQGGKKYPGLAREETDSNTIRGTIWL